MGCCISAIPMTRRAKEKREKELHRLRKSQISPPIPIGLEKSDSLSSSSSESSSDRCSYDPPTPPRPPVPENHVRPTFTVQPPTPQKNFDPDLDPESGLGHGFRLANDEDTKRQRDEELAEEMQNVGILVENLIHAIRAYSFANSQMRMLMMTDLDNIVKGMPRPPRGLLVRQKLQSLQTDIANLYSEKRRVFTRCFQVVLQGSEDGDGNEEHKEIRRDGRENGLESLWEGFMRLGDREKRDMAGRLHGRCTLMRIFELLSALRAGSEELLVLDFKISTRLQKDFESVLVELREFDGVGGGGGGDAVKKGIGESASMQWRVLGIVEGKRREELRARIEDVKRGRGRVSVALLGVVEGLAEDRDSEF
ncbi:hypothetical protein DL98DRAFT_590420 [Cadophora sp. DSE1049]|nr:hypothetical protein DL98DRAFT_590420 [Cadophora sp. DSE1049]